MANKHVPNTSAVEPAILDSGKFLVMERIFQSRLNR